MKTIEAQAREILTNIKLGGVSDSERFGIVWGPIDGNYCLSVNTRKVTNQTALGMIKNTLEKLSSDILITGVVSRVNQVIEGIEIKEGQHVLYRWIPENEYQEESGDYEGFQISLGDRWIDAESIDFEFLTML